jgi:hypothetical protein
VFLALIPPGPRISRNEMREDVIFRLCNMDLFEPFRTPIYDCEWWKVEEQVFTVCEGLQ